MKHKKWLFTTRTPFCRRIVIIMSKHSRYTRSFLLMLIAVALLYILSSYLILSHLDNDKASTKSVDAVIQNVRPRINARTYRVPEPCKGVCFGENGEPVILNETEALDLNRTMKKEFFNLIASNKISLWRSIPDTRHKDCKLIKYPNDLPTASVIFIFNNERWSPILRSVYSVINRSPRHLLKEVILIDDYSDLDELKQPLEDYCEEHFGEIVRILRTPKRLGLIAAKNFGGRAALGDVIVFFDAHIEANVGWLEPMLARIKERRSTIVCPCIDNIDSITMKYYGTGGRGWGIFKWSLSFAWGTVPQRVLDKINNSFTSPYPSPTMAGGLLAADRNFFFEIGGYDDGMEIWGGENLELSFRTWMCYGSLEFLPCSRVGHIYRHGHPYNMTGFHGRDITGRNNMRLAEVWLDDYKRYFYMFRKDLIGKTDYGDVSSRREIRDKLNCESFKWFLNNVYPEKFIFDQNVINYGHLKNKKNSLCLDTLGNDKVGDKIGLFYCQTKGSSNQLFSLTKTNLLRKEDYCLGPSGKKSSVDSYLYVSNCNEKNSLLKWKMGTDGSLINIKTGLCLDVVDAQNRGYPQMKECIDKDEKGAQSWSFKKYVV